MLEQSNKYYTPSIEEFHAGFEYEYYSEGLSELDIDGISGWYKAVFNFDIEEGEQKHPTKEVRVKYLDKEDIESLGFTIGIEGPHSYMSFNKDIYWIQYGSFTEDDSIQLSIQNIEMKEFIFWGIIKNKSELKTLLKWLQII